MDFIKIRGAREHNLKNIDLDIPKNRLVVFTGLSGSGKSSLAFDTIYAEGQRRYVESLSSYARQFLGVMDKPDVDHIEGLSPAISIDQKSTSHNPRSTVGTVTEIYDYLRLLFARVGHPHCPVCGREIAQLSVEQIVNLIVKEFENCRFLLLSPVIRDRKGEFTELFGSLRQKGFSQVRIDGKIVGLDEDIFILKNNKHSIDVVVDRLIIDKKTLRTSQPELRTRLFDSVEKAAKLSEGLCILAKVLDKSFELPVKPKIFEDHLFSQKFACPVDNISLGEIEPRIFSFNSPHGACPTCTGLGTLLKIEESLILNPNLTISEGGVLPYANTFTYDSWFAKKVAQFVPIRIPINNLTSQQINTLLYGTNDFEGIIPNLERRYRQTESEYIRTEIEKYMRKEICPSCQGKRLKPEALGITISLKSIVDIASLSITDSLIFLTNLTNLNDRESKISQPILKEIKERLGFLISVGLDYLTLDRTANTLAGGEAQRIRLASQIGSGLSGVLYVLDEPSIGLHQRDNQRLIDTLKRLRDLGNSVIVVEHDRDIMRQADWLVDFGPGAGEHGGLVISEGTPAHIMSDPKSLTGKYLSGKNQIMTIDGYRMTTNTISLKLTGASHHNLKNITVTFTLGKFISIAGVSGSGKSTLLIDTLYHALAKELNPDHKEKPGPYKSISISSTLQLSSFPALHDVINRVVMVDQSPIGRTPRSNPATYTGLFTPVREIYAMTPEARVRGYYPGRFSFNVKGGRCEACQGEGQNKIEMQFLPDVYVNCEVCHGMRYNSETLEVHFKGQNIAEVLNMTVEEASNFFASIPEVSDKLTTLSDVGLEYIRLGQPAPTLSGGEAQRVKLATELSKRSTGKTVYILDEPTTGLHFADLEKLLLVLRRLVNSGNTVIVIEHNLDVIKNSDWVIELGPGGGESGGHLIASCPPNELKKVKGSPTGQFLTAR
ncbi:excinuclease ABC subunit A [Candidatus Amesbacteria bacterium RIFCSPHIGHO2_01_FULL_48_32]|uniref:UvrABC system protein A n=1 Tax=Candidatus Amesbacteria bacterium RIFCSPLOWO2_01_FULL_48_25 TaxID=1797259 RepID=A0A1F4ZC33_9BACT|nr:MAG: excinuclease ABC subunit A [Candidatus Amesbacteria bacterium RIFCSPHIGHO2_01_FULL_48_32]OGD03890.1 MAG: excinuclease ABC subunit A [Candidatus Amesbacteria bacterium RIFCSPLOWO2_01_FULL_48_25]HJZ05446.1 excinuclease ABC subunit UvrA [Patescibacteria group bacterium]